MHKPKTRWLKSARISFADAGNIDHENGVIHDVIMCQVGEAKGHKVHLEQEFINDGIDYANKHHSRIGMKCRFGHPSMSNETLGSEMGRFKDFKVVGDKMVADLHLFNSAELSPTQPKMRSWMLSIAEEDPEAIMCSIVFKIDYYYQYDGDGNKVRVWEYDRKGRWISANSRMKVFVALKELLFCDIVDQGAATDKLFSINFNKDKFAVIADQFLDENPEIDQFIKENPEKLFEFIASRNIEEESEQSEDSETTETRINFSDWFRDKVLKIFNSNSNTNKSKEETMDFSRSLEILGNKGAPSAEELAEIKSEIQKFTGESEKFTREEVDQQLADAKSAHDKELAEKEKELADSKTKVTALEGQVKALEEASDDPEKPTKKGQEKLETAPTEEKEEASYSTEMAEKDLGD